jgi:pimeloyl-ACP methyl ester carboxylesterase
MRWARRWLLGKDDAPAEGDFPAATEADLQCTRSGQVLTDLRGKSVFDFTAARADELAAARAERVKGRGAAGLLDDVRGLISLKPSPASQAEVTDVGTVRQAGRQVRKLLVRTEPGIEVPALLVTPGTVDEGSNLVVGVGLDRTDALGPNGIAEVRGRTGQRVLLLELRGMGETSPTLASNANSPPSHFGRDSREAFLALQLNRPLLGQRVFDLIRVLDALRDEVKTGVHLVGRGTGGPIALHAAALDPRVTRLTLDGSILSWDGVVRTPVTRDQLTNVVPRALERYDLPDLAASLAPRPLTILAPVDPAGRPLPMADLERAVGPVRQAYRSRHADEQLVFQTGP